MKQKFAFFDFDDTLIHGDSIRYLLDYYIKKHPLSIFRLIEVGVLYIGYKLKICSFTKAKSAILFPLKNMSNKELQYFFEHHVADKYYQNVVAELKDKKEQGYQVWIVSASVEAYLQYCTLPVDRIIGTKVEMQDTHYTSKVIGKNCKNEAKVERIYEILNEKGWQIDYENSYAYSDSIHDVPMLKLVKHRIKVNKKNGEMSPFVIGG